MSDQPIRTEQVGCHWPDLQELIFGDFKLNISSKFKFEQNHTRITQTLHGSLLTFVLSCRLRDKYKKSVEPAKKPLTL